MVYDVMVVGGAPAGLTAGVYARTRKLSTLILEAQATGGQLEWLYPTKSVYDYPSYIAIEGGELAELFVLHSRESGAELRSEEVVDIQRAAGGFTVRTHGGTVHEGRAIILAMGRGLLEPKRLDVPGEAEFEGKGVDYRVRDRHDFKDKRVVVVGGGDSALEIALEIVAGAKKVILVHRRGEFRAMEKSVEAVMKNPIQVLFNSEVTSLEGDRKLERAVVYDNRTLKKTVIDVDAVIVNIGFEPKSTPLPKWGIELEGERLIRVKADMSTSVHGIYACGDMVADPGPDEPEEGEEPIRRERIHRSVVPLVRHDRELPRGKVGEGLLDSGIGAHPHSDGLRLDPLKLPNGPHEIVPDQAAPLRVDRLDGGPDPSRRFGARHRGPVDRREARVERRDPGIPRIQEAAVDIEQDRTEPGHVRAPPPRAARSHRRRGGSSRSPCPFPRGPSSGRP